MTYQDMITYLSESGWTQAEIAKEIGISQPSVFAISKGHSGIRAITADRLRRLYKKAVRSAKCAA